MNNLLVFSKSIVLKNNLVSIFSKSFLKRIWIILGITSLSLLIFYLFQVSSMLKAGFLLNSYEDRLVEANQQNRALEIELSQTVSLNNTSFLIHELGFQAVENVRHIKILEDFVATRKSF